MASDFIVLSHREPYAEVETEDGPVLKRKTNGVFTTLDSVSDWARTIDSVRLRNRRFSIASGRALCRSGRCPSL